LEPDDIIFLVKCSLLHGGHASAFKKGKKEFSKALIHVKGKRKVYATQVS